MPCCLQPNHATVTVLASWAVRRVEDGGPPTRRATCLHAPAADGKQGASCLPTDCALPQVISIHWGSCTGRCAPQLALRHNERVARGGLCRHRLCRAIPGSSLPLPAEAASAAGVQAPPGGWQDDQRYTACAHSDQAHVPGSLGSRRNKGAAGKAPQEGDGGGFLQAAAANPAAGAPRGSLRGAFKAHSLRALPFRPCFAPYRWAT